jgi:hypothetical protein
MRYKLVFILFYLYSGLSYSQRYYIDTTILGRLADPPVTLGVYYSFSSSSGFDSTYFFVSFPRNGHTETEVFAEYHGFERGYDTIHLEARQLDGKGMPEIIASFLATDHGSGSWWEQKEIHIWNLDTRMEMFSDEFAYDQWYFDINRFRYYPEDSTIAKTPMDSIKTIDDSINGIQESFGCKWSYEIRFDSNGTLTISPFKIDAYPAIDPTKNLDWTCSPKHMAGTYVIKNGVYVLKEK